MAKTQPVLDIKLVNLNPDRPRERIDCGFKALSMLTKNLDMVQ
jgi:hypothetical protein